jgi:SAM-dependent methyltransferase
VLQRVLPVRGRVLEVASGTGQHVVHFARAMPGLTWLPSDPEAPHREAIQARIAAAGLGNIASPLRLDVLELPWPIGRADAVVCINMIHIAPWEAALSLLREAAVLLPEQGVLYLYGPYRRDGVHTAESNAAFDADLRRRDPAWGVRNLEDVAEAAGANGLVLEQTVEMPANNLSLVFCRRVPGPGGTHTAVGSPHGQ